MSLQHIDPNPRMSEAVIHGNKIYLSGMVAENGTTVAEQTADILAQIDVLLGRARTCKKNIIKANIWLTDITTIGEMNSVWDAWVVEGHTPARATVEARLADPSWLVEIMVEAAL